MNVIDLTEEKVRIKRSPSPDIILLPDDNIQAPPSPPIITQQRKHTRKEKKERTYKLKALVWKNSLEDAQFTLQNNIQGREHAFTYLLEHVPTRNKEYDLRVVAVSSSTTLLLGVLHNQYKEVIYQAYLNGLITGLEISTELVAEKVKVWLHVERKDRGWHAK